MRWQHFWFQPRSTEPLELVRILLAGSLLFSYGLMSGPDVLNLYGAGGLFSVSSLEHYHGSSYVVSAFFYLTEDWQTLIAHGIFVAAFGALMLGLFTRLSKWVALTGQLSYMNMNPLSTYGVDEIAASLLLLLCFAPVGIAMSLDGVRKSQQLMSDHGLHAVLNKEPSPWGFACMRMMQLQMVVLYLYSGVSKLKGESWLNGEALWYALFDVELSWIFLPFFAEHLWLARMLTWGALALELVYVFLIWLRRFRVYLLAAIVVLHLGIAVFLAMPLFALVMIAGNFAFVPHQWFENLRRRWGLRVGEMQMFYDGQCDFCIRSMTWLLAFDSMGLVKPVDLHKCETTRFSQDEARAALMLIKADGSLLKGYSAYRHVVLSVPGLWWLAPAFCVPWLSRWAGDAIYGWVARNRGRL